MRFSKPLFESDQLSISLSVTSQVTLSRFSVEEAKLVPAENLLKKDFFFRFVIESQSRASYILSDSFRGFIPRE